MFVFVPTLPSQGNDGPAFKENCGSLISSIIRRSELHGYYGE